MLENKIKEPIIIIGCPRSGTSLLHRILSESPDTYSLYRESQDIFNSFYLKKKVQYKEYNDDSLSEDDLNNEYKEFLLKEFHNHTSNLRPVASLITKFLNKSQPTTISNVAAQANGMIKDTFVKEYKIVEKNPRACFRIPFMNKLFPKAKYIYLTRDGRSNISSLIEGWRRGSTHNRIPLPNIALNIKGYDKKRWRYILPPSWESCIGKNLEEVCAFQWVSANEHAQRGLQSIDSERVYKVSYEELTEDLEASIESICNFSDIKFTNEVKNLCKKPPVVSTPKNDGPRKDKWLKNKKLLENVYPTIEPMMKNLGYDLDNQKELIKN